MSVHPSKRLAIVCACILGLAAAACQPKEPPLAESTSLSTSRSTAMAYTMNSGDSIGPICIHLAMPYSDRICPDSSLYQYFRQADVSSLRLTVVTTGGLTRNVTLDPRTDAIFLTHSAISTFLLRHYDATDAAKAADLRAFMGTAFRP